MLLDFSTRSHHFTSITTSIMYYPPGAVSTDSTEANPIEIFFINNGLPWTQAIEKFLSKKGFKNVELLKLLKDDEWDNLFVNEKIVQKRLASVVFKDLQADSLKAPKCVTQTPLKSHDSEPTPLKTNKRKVEPYPEMMRHTSCSDIIRQYPKINPPNSLALPEQLPVTHIIVPLVLEPGQRMQDPGRTLRTLRRMPAPGERGIL